MQLIPDDYADALRRRLRTTRSALSTRRGIIVITFALVLAVAAIAYAVSAPAAFPEGKLVRLPQGESAPVLADALERDGLIRSAFAFRVLARLSGKDGSLQGGAYVFEERAGLAEVLRRVSEGDRGINAARITLTEGMTVRDMADTLAAGVPGFDRATFLSAADGSEGYLFPDTYFILPDTTEADIVARLKANFATKTASSSPTGAEVILASLLEREANKEEDMRIVAGILYNRLAIDMPLQVDAVFGYIQGQNGYTPTAADLESDSPYNTYRVRGLPPGPISNPGLMALDAAQNPIESKYFYYLTGRDGLMYYAVDFEGHKRNRVLYLD